MFRYEHAIGERTFTLACVIRRGCMGDHENPPESDEVEVVAITEDGTDAIATFNALLAATDDLDAAWAHVEECVLAAANAARADAMERPFRGRDG